MTDIAVQAIPSMELSNGIIRDRNSNRQTKPIRLSKTSAIPIDMIRTTNEISREVASDIVHWAIGKSMNPRNEYVKTMRRMVGEMLDKHSSLLRGLVNRFDVQRLGFDASLKEIADEEFGDGEANWGRIVALCAFIARLSQHFQDTGIDDHVEALSRFLQNYFNDRLDAWIASEGGWDQVANRFRSDSNLESKIFKGLLATGLAFGVLAGVAALR